MAGNTDVQLSARDRRGRLIPRGLFRETNFVYMGDTVVIWDLQSCVGMPKLRDEVLRKCQKRKAREVAVAPNKPLLRNNKKRFRRIMEHLYHQSLKMPQDSACNADDPIVQQSKFRRPLEN
jgi:hypothetical protein